MIGEIFSVCSTSRAILALVEVPINLYESLLRCAAQLSGSYQPVKRCSIFVGLLQHTRPRPGPLRNAAAQLLKNIKLKEKIRNRHFQVDVDMPKWSVGHSSCLRRRAGEVRNQVMDRNHTGLMCYHGMTTCLWVFPHPSVPSAGGAIWAIKSVETVPWANPWVTAWFFGLTFVSNTLQNSVFSALIICIQLGKSRTKY